MNQLSKSRYEPGDWALPDWWTQDIPSRNGRATHAEQVTFFNGAFVRNVIGHHGGITRLPTIWRRQ